LFKEIFPNLFKKVTSLQILTVSMLHQTQLVNNSFGDSEMVISTYMTKH